MLKRELELFPVFVRARLDLDADVHLVGVCRLHLNGASVCADVERAAGADLKGALDHFVIGRDVFGDGFVRVGALRRGAFCVCAVGAAVGRLRLAVAEASKSPAASGRLLLYGAVEVFH